MKFIEVEGNHINPNYILRITDTMYQGVRSSAIYLIDGRHVQSKLKREDVLTLIEEAFE